MKLNETIEFHIKTASLALMRLYNSVAQRQGITQTIGWVLVFVEREGTPSTKLARELGMKNSSLTRILQNMEQKGLIERRADSLDKRITRIFLTPEGVRLRKEVKADVLAFNQKILSQLSPGQYEAFTEVLAHIKKAYEEEINQHK